jgi:hypothetical protein
LYPINNLRYCLLLLCRLTHPEHSVYFTPLMKRSTPAEIYSAQEERGVRSIQLTTQMEAACLFAGARFEVGSSEWQAALILLEAAKVGPNVDRLVLRTRLPREFVARALRRLIDNSFWLDGVLYVTWCADSGSTDGFWDDVDVALGRSLRRIGADGKPEWAAVREWVKWFEYRGVSGAPSSIQNDYHTIAEYNPDPIPSSPIHEEEADLQQHLAPPAPQTRSDATSSEADVYQQRGAQSPTLSLSVGSELLIGDWATADWLG